MLSTEVRQVSISSSTPKEQSILKDYIRELLLSIPPEKRTKNSSSVNFYLKSSGLYTGRSLRSLRTTFYWEVKPLMPGITDSASGSSNPGFQERRGKERGAMLPSEG